MIFSFFPSKKAQGMSLKVIIVAVIALVVLVVLIMIFASKTRFFSTTTSGCAARNGECKDGILCPEGYLRHPGAACPDNQICCAPFDDSPQQTPPAQPTPPT
jgi:hypothetical protein